MPLTYTLKRVLEDERVPDATTVAFSPDGLLLATGSSSGRVAIWSVEEGQVMDTFLGRSAVTALIWKQGGTKQRGSHGFIFIGWHQGDIAVIQVFEGTVRIEGYLAHDVPVEAIAFKANPMRLATGGSDQVRTWAMTDAPAAKPLHFMSKPESTAANAGQARRVASLHWLDHTEHLLASFVYHGIVMYDAVTSQIVQVLHIPTMISLSPDNQTIVVHNLNGGFDSYELKTGKLVKEYRPHVPESGSGAILPFPSLYVHSGSAILGGMPTGATCWDTADGFILTTLEHAAGTVQALAAHYIDAKDLFLLATGVSKPSSRDAPIAAHIYQTIDMVDESTRRTHCMQAASTAIIHLPFPVPYFVSLLIIAALVLLKMI
ncbi:WD40 repeat-like protein [Rickenella mellea]|uniref:WD40 repeat-like protein n=1 Tax=Rickenella mellea TaxID=50990 RepID=A0A4Y7PMT7_9AGAM|nr:WD40 repeat-like protein [Rickenella mellea]